MQRRVNRNRAGRKVGESSGRGFSRTFGHVERLESRAVLSGEGALLLPPPIAPSGVVDAADVTRPIVVSPPAITPVAATRLRLTIPPQVRAGTPTLMTAVALDAAGRPVPTFTGSATVSSSDGAASLPLIEVIFRNGRASFAVTFATAGRQTVSLRMLSGDPSARMSARASTLVTASPTLAAFLVAMPRRVDAGKPVSVSIVAVNAQGRPVPTFSGTATLSSSDSAATLPSSVRFLGGRATVRVTFGTLGEQTLTVTSGPSVGGSISGTAKTQVAEVVTQRIRTLPAAGR